MLFSELTTKRKEESCLENFKSVLLMGKFILLITGENDFSMCGVLLNFVKNENLAKYVVENLSNEQMSVERVMEEFVKSLDDKLL